MKSDVARRAARPAALLLSPRGAVARAGAVLALLGAAVLVAGCGNDANSARTPSGPPPVLISLAPVQTRAVEVYEDVIGSLENVNDPRVSAEIAGRITRVAVSVGNAVKRGDLLAELDTTDFEIQQRADAAEIARSQTLLAQQERVVERQQKLVAQGFISQNAAEDALAQRNALRESLVAARARAEASRRSLTKARVVAPIDGEVETRSVAVGDYVKLGDPMFKLVGTQRLRAVLLLPEAAASRIRPGLKVELVSPAAPDKPIASVIEEIKPMVGTANRALNAIVSFTGDGNAFRGGGSVNARIITEVRHNALLVPEQSVVLRPAGKVVYAIKDGKAEQRVVETGVRQEGMYEILKGLAPGEQVAVDSAGFLTDGARVALPTPPAAGEGKGGARKGRSAAAVNSPQG